MPSPRDPQSSPASATSYERPTLTMLGGVAELTLGGLGEGMDTGLASL